jgi:sortase A
MRKGKFLKIIAVVWAISGVVILAGVVLPIFFYKYHSQDDTSVLANPVPTTKPDLVKENIDYTKASNWFTGGAIPDEFIVSKINYYNISIPKLKIKDAIVAIGGEDLSKNLIQYPGTALPGKNGNSVIFGHSILPIFYNPSDYVSIFSLLPNLKKGDEVFVNYDNVAYIYKVEDMFEVKPTDIQVLQQVITDSFLTLVTCVPPGDPAKSKRLIVKARVVPLEN